MITIVDYGMGNLGSIQSIFKRIGVKSQITSDITLIKESKKILLPGVGAFDAAMKKINSSDFREILDIKALEEQVPILGICLGMQLLTNKSEEGKLDGLGWIKGETIKFNFAKQKSLKIPHMGWNIVNEINSSDLTKDLPAEPRFYFVHSYYVNVECTENQVMQTHYGHDFDSVISSGNIFGAQFHPEKSHKFGMQLLKNFAEL